MIAFNIRAVSRFFASPKAGSKCKHGPLFSSLVEDVSSSDQFPERRTQHLAHEAWIFHLYKLVDIDSLPTWSTETQQLGTGVIFIPASWTEHS